MRRRWWIALLVVAVALLSRAATGEEWIVKILREQIEKQLVGKVEIGKLSGDIPSHVWLRDVVIHDAEGKEAIRVAELELKIKVLSLISKKIEIESLRASGVSVHVRELKDG